jgi:hypothetical protein
MEAIPILLFALILMRWTQTTLVEDKAKSPAPSPSPEEELLIALGKVLGRKP